MKYYLIAGEPSGDLHGSNLIKGLLKADPEARLRFWGGDLMAAAGGEANLAKHYRETSFFGIVQVLKNLRTIKRQMRECRADVAAFAPDVLILVDYPGFNMKMARWAKEHGIRTFYYIAPKVWAWREWRVKAIRRWVDRLFVIFPFECGYFPRHGVEPIFEGNPLVDAIEARRTSLPSPDEFRRRHGLDRRPIIALLAGSRRGEIRDNLPLMADLSRKFPGHQFVVAGVAWLDRALYEQYMAGSGIRYVCDQTYETLAAAEAAVVTSGTATLETALLGIPEVVVYRTLWFQVRLRPYVLKVPWVSLVNLNLGARRSPRSSSPTSTPRAPNASCGRSSQAGRNADGCSPTSPNYVRLSGGRAPATVSPPGWSQNCAHRKRNNQKLWTISRYSCSAAYC